MGSAGLGSVVWFHCLFTQGLGSRSNPCLGQVVYGWEIMLREWEHTYSTSWNLTLNHHSGPSTTFCQSKHVTRPSPVSLGQRLYFIHREAVLTKEVNSREEVMPPFLVPHYLAWDCGLQKPPYSPPYHCLFMHRVDSENFSILEVRGLGRVGNLVASLYR